MKIRILVGVLLGVLLTGCSSKPSEMKYYHLNDTSETSVLGSSPASDNKHYVQLASIKVPDYLKQSKLVMRTGPYEMHFSASNLWVQTPEKEIRAALLADLNSSASDHYFINFEPTITGKVEHQLHVEITHFFPTEDSEVLLHGSWTLVSQNASRTDHKFQLSQDLSADGYAHAVSRQRVLIAQLAQEINTQLRGK